MKKILVSVDGSEHSQNVVNAALEIGKFQKTQITLLSVVQEEVAYYYGEYLNYDQIQKLSQANKTMYEETKKGLEKLLDELGKSLETENIILEKVVQTGSPAEEIVKMAESGQYDLIIIGSRGLSAPKKLFLGSVSQRVLNEAKCPVLVVKKH
jgi:nucleotide-binding universal stress UspA family protein